MTARFADMFNKKRKTMLNKAITTRAINLSKSGYSRKLANKNKDFTLRYIQNGGRLPKLDSFMLMKQGTLVKTLDEINAARTTKPGKRGSYKTWHYFKQILTTVPKNSKMMFLERHDKFPEYYQFCIIGGGNVWIDISDFLSSLSIMKPPSKSRKRVKDTC